MIRAAAILLVITLVCIHVEGAAANVRLHAQTDYFDRKGRMDMGPNEGKLFSSLREVVPEGAVILTNHRRIPLMRYWSERPVYRASGMRWPRDDAKNGRLEMELAVSHLRQLYQEKLPPLYYVFNLFDSVDVAYRYDAMLRFFLSGSVEYSDAGWLRDREMLSLAASIGRCTNSFCPIVLARGSIICFDLTRAVPLLKQESLGYPSLRQFGPMP